MTRYTVHRMTLPFTWQWTQTGMRRNGNGIAHLDLQYNINLCTQNFVILVHLFSHCFIFPYVRSNLHVHWLHAKRGNLHALHAVQLLSNVSRPRYFPVGCFGHAQVSRFRKVFAVSPCVARGFQSTIYGMYITAYVAAIAPRHLGKCSSRPAQGHNKFGAAQQTVVQARLCPVAYACMYVRRYGGHSSARVQVRSVTRFHMLRLRDFMSLKLEAPESFCGCLRSTCAFTGYHQNRQKRCVAVS